MSNLRVIKVILIAVIWLAILIRGTLVMAQLSSPTREFFNVAQIAPSCTFLAGPDPGTLVESYSGGETTSLVANPTTNPLRGQASRALIDCKNPLGTYAIITSPEFDTAESSPNISTIITTGITTLYKSPDDDGNQIYDSNLTPIAILSVVGNGKTPSTSSPVLLSDADTSDVKVNFGVPTWFLIGMEIMLNRQGAPSGTFTFKSELTLLPK